MTGNDVLKIPMIENDIQAQTIGVYLISLLDKLWDEGEGFSGKRPFGNSGWEYEIYHSLVKAEVIEGSVHKYEENGVQWEEYEVDDKRQGNELINKAIEALYDKVK
jgi:hypothetical protein